VFEILGHRRGDRAVCGQGYTFVARRQAHGIGAQDLDAAVGGIDLHDRRAILDQGRGEQGGAPPKLHPDRPKPIAAKIAIARASVFALVMAVRSFKASSTKLDRRVMGITAI